MPTLQSTNCGAGFQAGRNVFADGRFLATTTDNLNVFKHEMASAYALGVMQRRYAALRVCPLSGFLARARGKKRPLGTLGECLDRCVAVAACLCGRA